jgi:hypothetical protein
MVGDIGKDDHVELAIAKGQGLGLRNRNLEPLHRQRVDRIAIGVNARKPKHIVAQRSQEGAAAAPDLEKRPGTASNHALPEFTAIDIFDASHGLHFLGSHEAIPGAFDRAQAMPHSAVTASA